MILAILAVLIVIGSTGVYAVARRRYGLDRDPSLVLGGITCSLAIIVGAVATIGGGGSDSSTALPAIPASGGVTSATSTTSATAPPSMTPLSLAEVRQLPVNAIVAQGGADQVAFNPPSGGSYDPAKYRLTARHGTIVTMSGWAASVPGKMTYGGVLAIVDNVVVALGTYHLDRLDVANNFNTPEIRYCGFQIRLPIVAPGSHVLKLAFVMPDQKTYAIIPVQIAFVVTK